MLNDFNCSCPVYIACGYTDLRRGIDGLANLVKSQFQMDPFQRALFLFCGRRRDGFLPCFVVSFSYGKQEEHCRKHPGNGDHLTGGI